jgi:hypothetical protein
MKFNTGSRWYPASGLPPAWKAVISGVTHQMYSPPLAAQYGRKAKTHCKLEKASADTATIAWNEFCRNFVPQA